MKTIPKNFRAANPNKKSQAGQTLVEYVLLLSLAIGVSLQIYRGVNTSIRRGFLVLNAELEKNMQTGGFREASTYWAN